jgi:hypothetical protein
MSELRSTGRPWTDSTDCRPRASDPRAVEEPAQHQHRMAVTPQRAPTLPCPPLGAVTSEKAGQEGNGGLPDRERGGVADRIGHAGPRSESIFGRTASSTEVPHPTWSSPRHRPRPATQHRYWERLNESRGANIQALRTNQNGSCPLKIEEPVILAVSSRVPADPVFRTPPDRTDNRFRRVEHRL